MTAPIEKKRRERTPWPPLGDIRWRTDLSALPALPPFSESWLRVHGSRDPVKWSKPLTAELVDAMGVYAWAQCLVTDVLTCNEYQVFVDYARGIGCADVARSRFKSQKTISTYYARIREKTGLRNIAEIIVYAMRHGLVQWGELPVKAPVSLSAADAKVAA